LLGRHQCPALGVAAHLEQHVEHVPGGGPQRGHGQDGEEDLVTWAQQAPGVPVPATRVEELAAAAVRGPAGFQME
jgi:hypothetical protein